jgi:hypothetical protein
MCIHVARVEPKFTALLGSHVQLFCILAGQNLFCCNLRVHGSAHRLRDVDAVTRFAGDLT